jgi:CHAT domain-containing protein/tetratricopeptide (TPR) repeat protein
MNAENEKSLSELKQEVNRYIESGEFIKALPVSERALKLAKKEYGDESLEYAEFAHIHSVVNKMLGHCDVAKEAASKAYDIQVLQLGSGNLLTLDSYAEMGMVEYRASGYKNAERILLGCAEQYAEQNAENQTYATVLNVLGLVYKETGDFRKAEKYFNDSMSMRMKLFGSDNFEVVKSMNNLGTLYRLQGNYLMADRMFREVLDYFERNSRQDHIYYGTILNNLGMVHHELGDLEKGKEYYEEALKVRKLTSGEDSVDYANSLANLGIIYKSLGNNELAARNFKDSLGSFLNIIGSENPYFANGLHSLGQLHMDIGNYRLGSKFQNLAIKKYIRLLGPSNLSTLLSGVNLAILHLRTGEFDKSETESREIIDILDQNYPNDTNLLSRARLNLAIVLTTKGETSQAWNLMNEVVASDNRLIKQFLSFGSDHARLEFIQAVQERTDILLSLVSKYFPENEYAIKHALDTVIKRKGITFEVMAAGREAVYSGKYPEHKRMLEILSDLRMDIARESINGPRNGTPEEYKQRLKNWIDQKESLEHELAQVIPEIELEEKLHAADVDAVRSALPPDSALVEFIRYRDYRFAKKVKNADDEWTHPRYVAFVMKPDDEAFAKMVDLGKADIIDSVITEYRNAILRDSDDSFRSASPQKNSAAQSEYVGPGELLRILILDKLTPFIDGCIQLILSPDSYLNTLPFESIPVNQDEFLIDKFHISYLSASRDILRNVQETNGNVSPPVIIADPDYDIGEVIPDKVSDLIATQPNGQYRNAAIDLTGIEFNRLPGTRIEGSIVSGLLNSEPWFEDRVLEHEFKGISSPSILHIATHGYFLEQVPNGSNTWSKNPLLHSGLAFAGANTSIKGGTVPEDAEDGILTSEDVSALNLTGTDLVVLSACDSGLGVVRNGEGVFGLRRVFMLAGAKTLVMSLWKVPDFVTILLMERFYSNLINGLGRGEALRNAQIYIRDLNVDELKKYFEDNPTLHSQLRESEPLNKQLEKLLELPLDHSPFSHPIYWGAFITQGDAGPIKFSWHL